jgi:hypothetical protein
MQSVIALTDRLWKSLVRPPRVRRSACIPAAGRLAPWSATLTRFDGRSYVIAVAAHSGLTLVVAAATVEVFKSAMSAALRGVFTDLELPQGALRIEASDIASASIVRLRDPGIRHELDYVECISGTEFPYHDDVRRVQRNLNELPRGNQSPCVPHEAVRLLFESGSGDVRVGL